jgi:hypothetical protein
MSPKTYEMGKKSTPAPKTTAPKNGSSICTAFAGPIRFEQMRTVTNAAITKS